MSNTTKPHGKVRSVFIVLLLFIFINFAFELLVGVIEYVLPISLYKMFPFTRLLILGLVIYFYRQKRRGSKELATNGKRLLVIAGLAIVTLIGVGIVASISSPVDSELVSKNTLAKAYLDKNGEDYARCYNSINYGSTVINSVTLSYTNYDTPEAEMQKIKATEAGFAQKIKDQCQKNVDEYESNFKAYQTSTTELEKSSESLLSKMLGMNSRDNASGASKYEPSLVRLKAGSPFTLLVFTEDDVATYYKAQLGY